MNVRDAIRSGLICKGMTKAQVREVLGPPEYWGVTSRKYKEPRIWGYDGIEFWFNIKPWRAKYPGPELVTVFDNDKHEVITLEG